MSDQPMIQLTPEQWAALPDHLKARMATPANGQGQMPPDPPPLESGGGQEALVAFANALSAIQPIAKTQTADTGKYTYRYADLGDVLEEVKRACEMFKLSVTQNPTMMNGNLAVGTTIIHSVSGQWLTFPSIQMKMPNDAQAVGSALTYLRRYALLTIFGIAPEDDDGAVATRSARQVEQSGGLRSEAERLFHEEMQSMPVEESRAMRAEFKAVFGMGLSDLPISKHGDALTWLRQWSPPAAAEGAGEEAAGEVKQSDAAPPAAPTIGGTAALIRQQREAALDLPGLEEDEAKADAAERAGIAPEAES